MIKCVIRSIKNKLDQKTKFYPAVVYTGTVTQTQLTDLISAKTTVTRADVVCVLAALEEAIAEKLANSQAVRLGDVGSFVTSIRSNGGETDKTAIEAKHIKRVRALFHPSVTMKRRLNEEASPYLSKKRVLGA